VPATRWFPRPPARSKHPAVGRFFVWETIRGQLGIRLPTGPGVLLCAKTRVPIQGPHGYDGRGEMSPWRQVNLRAERVFVVNTAHPRHARLAALCAALTALTLAAAGTPAADREDEP
jgi:hypothetical protein